MTFAALEESIEDGQPIYLYRFMLNEKVWYYTSADGRVFRSEVWWEAEPIGDDGVKQSGEPTSDALTVTASAKIVPAMLYMEYPPAQPIQLAIFETHEGDTEVKAVYIGEISNCKVPMPGTAVFTVETLAATMSRMGLRLGWQRNCPYVVYDPVTCRLNKAAYAVAATVTAVVDNQVTATAISGSPVGYFDGGFVEWTDPVRGMERRGIELSSGSILVMFGSAEGIVEGTVLTAYPGCARTKQACINFGNILNYGGVDSLQGTSPFDGDPVFN